MDRPDKVDGSGWTVTACSQERGIEFGCRISTSIVTLHGEITRTARSFRTAQEAAVEGVKEGMSWADS